jgi:hypothetical protein
MWPEFAIVTSPIVALGRESGDCQPVRRVTSQRKGLARRVMRKNDCPGGRMRTWLELRDGPFATSKEHKPCQPRNSGLEYFVAPPRELAMPACWFRAASSDFRIHSAASGRVSVAYASGSCAPFPSLTLPARVRLFRRLRFRLVCAFSVAYASGSCAPFPSLTLPARVPLFRAHSPLAEAALR